MVVGAHDEGQVLDDDDDQERPEDEREDAEDVGVGRVQAVLAGEALLDRVEGRRADVAVDDAERGEPEHHETGAVAGGVGGAPSTAMGCDAGTAMLVALV